MKANPGSRLVSALMAVLFAGCATYAPAPNYQALVASSDRSEADRKTDTRRNPVQLLKFYDVRPGMTVADLGAGAGYNAELLVRAVGPNGRVYAQNSQFVVENIVKDNFDKRMQKPVMKNVVRVIQEFEDPLPFEAHNLDLVTFNFFYHDTVWLGADRARMNRAIFSALKRGGILIIADHSGRPGTGTAEARTLHRIEESVLRREVEAAGFRLVAEERFLRNPDDPRNTPVDASKIRNDEFVLKFVKP